MVHQYQLVSVPDVSRGRPVWRRDNGLDVGAQVAVTLLPEGPQAEALPAEMIQRLEAGQRE